MGLADAAMSTAAGIAVFAIVVFVAATGLGGVVPNPVQVAIPAGIGFGMAAMTGTYIGLAAKTHSRAYRASFASGAFGVTFVGVFLVAFGTSTVAVAVASAAGAGLLAAVGVTVAAR